MWSGALFALNALLNLGLALALAWALPASAFGAFTVYLAAALLLGNLAYDWVRLSAIRFYTPLARTREPALRATLDVAFCASTGLARSRSRSSLLFREPCQSQAWHRSRRSSRSPRRTPPS